MRPALLIPVLTLGLPACVLSPQQWQDARDEAVCEVLVTCFDQHPSIDACVQQAADGDEPPCDTLRYGAVTQCLRQLRAQADDCPDSLAAWQIPTTCASVCRVEDG